MSQRHERVPNHNTKIPTYRYVSLVRLDIPLGTVPFNRLLSRYLRNTTYTRETKDNHRQGSDPKHTTSSDHTSKCPLPVRVRVRVRAKNRVTVTFMLGLGLSMVKG